MKVAVAGGTGVLGRRVVVRLREAGHAPSVLAHARTTGLSPAEVVAGDLLQPATLPRWLGGCDAALHLATALRPDAQGVVDWAANDRVRSVGSANLVQACAHAGVRRLVVQSVAFLDGGSRWLDGTEALADRPFLQSARAMEALVLDAAAHDVLVLRGGLFYGPGTATGAGWEAAARARRWPLPANADDHVSLVHVDDMAAAVCAATGGAGGRGVLSVVDDRPVRWRELVAGLSAMAGGVVDPAPALPLPSFRVSNRLARERLDWAPRYPTWTDGIRSEPWLQAR